MIKGLLTLIIGANTKGFDSALGRSGKKLKRFSALTAGATKVLGAFGGALAIGSLVADAARRIAAFDAAMVNLSSILRTTRKDIKNLEDQAISLGGSTIFTAGQVGELQTILARFGFVNEEIEGATKGILDLAAATRIDLNQAATVTAGTLRSFNIEASESGRVADVITNAMTKSALTVDDFAQGMVYAAPLAKQLGISLEETAAAMAILANNNIKGSIAGTSLRRIFTELGKEGYTLSDIFKGNADALKLVTDKLGFAKDAAGQYALSSFLVLSENAGIIDQFTKKMSEIGSSTAVANKQLESITNRIIIFKSSWEGLILSIDQGQGVFSTTFKQVLDDASTILQAQRLSNQGFDADKMGFVTKELNMFEESWVGLVETVRKATPWEGIVEEATKVVEANKLYNDQLRESRKLMAQIKKENPDVWFLNPPSLFPEQEEEQAPLTPKQLAFMNRPDPESNEDKKAREDYKREQIRLEELFHKQLLEVNRQREVEISLYDEATKSYRAYIQTRTEMAKAQSKGVGMEGGEEFQFDSELPTPDEMFDPDRENGPKIGFTDEEMDKMISDNLALEKSFERLGQSIGDSLSKGEDSWEQYSETLREVVMDLIGAAIAQGVAALVANAMESAAASGPYGFALAPALGGLAAGLAKTAFNSAIPQFAEGGIVSGPTLGLMGEYAGASRNPEVIAPLNKLKGMMGDGSKEIEVSGKFELEGRALVATIDRENTRQKRYGS